MNLLYTQYPSPIGLLTLVSGEKGLRGLYMERRDGVSSIPPQAVRADEAFVAIGTQLTDYFAGRLQRFTIDLDMDGTPFQKQVWQALCEIPYGTTISYGEQARRINNPAAVRAVGAANGQNRIAIIVPCHRVIGANGTLTGFGGGLDRKRLLLDLEAGINNGLYPLCLPPKVTETAVPQLFRGRQKSSSTAVPPKTDAPDRPADRTAGCR